MTLMHGSIGEENKDAAACIFDPFDSLCAVDLNGRIAAYSDPFHAEREIRGRRSGVDGPYRDAPGMAGLFLQDRE